MMNDECSLRPASPSILNGPQFILQHSSFIPYPPPVTPTGFEPNSTSACSESGYGNPTGAGVAHLYANQPDSNLIDPDLATVVEAWPALPEATRASIVTMIRAATANR
jgi:hypothetical protein